MKYVRNTVSDVNITIVRGLRTYYTGRGLYGKRLNSAVLRDAIAIRHRQHFPNIAHLANAFTWDGTAQGFHYWWARTNE